MYTYIYIWSTSLLGVYIYSILYMYACGFLTIDQTLAIVLTDFTGRSPVRLPKYRTPLGRLVFEHVRTLQPNFLDEAG